jgi:RIO kinase 1
MPENLAALVEYGVIQEVVRPLMSGKEAQIYLVVAEGEERVAKVYKEAQARTFKHRAEYTEGRKTRNSRDQRAISKRTRHGRARDEAAWRSTEVDMIYRLRDAGVRVPEVINFVEGVLVMELIKDSEGNPAPRLGDLTFDSKQARDVYDVLIGQVVRMLCAGVVHGDLSDFNVLMGADGPAVIDFPQAVDPASNQNGRRLLIRDVENLHRFLLKFAPHARCPRYAEEMWELYQGNRLTPETKLGGQYRAPRGKTDMAEVLTLIGEAGDDERARREARGEDLGSLAPETESKPTPAPFRKVVDLTQERSGGRKPQQKPNAAKRSGRKARPQGAGAKPSNAEPSNAKRSGAKRPTNRASMPEGAKVGNEASVGEKTRRRRRRQTPKGQEATKGGASATPRRAPASPAHASDRTGAKDERTPARSPPEGAAQPTPRPAKKRARRRRRPNASAQERKPSPR